MDAKAIFDKALRDNLDRLEIELPARQAQTLWAHHCAVVEANRQFNLTRITDPAEAAVKHYADSLALVRWVRDAGLEVRRVLDVGTGAGAPAVPLAVVEPDWQVTAIDGTAKKINFVADAVRQISLENLTAIHARAEHWDSDRHFDLVLFKAIGSLDRCLKWGRPHVARGGYVVVFKTAAMPEEERSAGSTAAGALGFADAEVFRYELVLCGETLSRALWNFRLR